MMWEEEVQTDVIDQFHLLIRLGLVSAFSRNITRLSTRISSKSKEQKTVNVEDEEEEQPSTSQPSTFSRNFSRFSARFSSMKKKKKEEKEGYLWFEAFM